MFPLVMACSVGSWLRAVFWGFEAGKLNRQFRTVYLFSEEKGSEEIGVERGLMCLSKRCGVSFLTMHNVNALSETKKTNDNKAATMAKKALC